MQPGGDIRSARGNSHVALANVLQRRAECMASIVRDIDVYEAMLLKIQNLHSR